MYRLTASHQGVAQLEEYLAWDQDAVGSNPTTLTKNSPWSNGSDARFSIWKWEFDSPRRDQMALSSIGRKTASLAEKPGSTPGSVTKCPRGAIGRHDWFRSNILQVQLLSRTPKCLRSRTGICTRLRIWILGVQLPSEVPKCPCSTTENATLF